LERIQGGATFDSPPIVARGNAGERGVGRVKKALRLAFGVAGVAMSLTVYAA
jgi:hypothetical protein